MSDDASRERDATDGDEGEAEDETTARSSSESIRDSTQWDDSSTWSASDGWSSSDSGSDSSQEPREHTPVDGTAADSGSERIPLDLSRDVDSVDAEGPESDADEDEDDHYEPEPRSAPVEAGDPDLENAVFVVLGAIVMILVFLRLVSIPL